MFDFLKKLGGKTGESPDLPQLVRAGAQIVDVRTPEEFRGGHGQGSVNIPLQQLDRGLSRLRKDLPVITCCASGMRSASAKGILERHGFVEVVNGGGWAGLARLLGK
jgi:rhodanese-related sulfurtransferase